MIDKEASVPSSATSTTNILKSSRNGMQKHGNGNDGGMDIDDEI